MPLLTKAGLVNGVSGKKGGYSLTKKPSEYNAGDVLRLTEGTLAPVYSEYGLPTKDTDMFD